MLIGHIALLAYSATQHSPVFAEANNILAGVRLWQTGKNDLFVVNPPLSRMVGSIPFVVAGVKPHWGLPDSHVLRPEYVLSRDLVDSLGSRAIWLFALARWACIPLSAIGLIVCFLWARDLYGHWPGVLVAALWSFSPDILGHGALATADVAAASMGVLSGYVYWHWLRQATWCRACVSGGVLGLVLLTKGTWIILLVLWPLLWFVYELSRKSASLFFGHTLQMGVILGLGVLVLNAGYGFQGSFRLLGQYEFHSNMFGGPKVFSYEGGNQFRDTLLAVLPVPLPESYLRGIDLQELDFELGYLSYLGGQWRSPGWWYYYLFAYALKTPLGVQCLTVLALGTTLFRGRSDVSEWCDECCLLLPTVAIVTSVSYHTGMNHHFRYVLPALPFLWIWAGQVGAVFSSRVWKTVIVALSVWAAISSVCCYPHNLSYFNEVIGGPKNGHHYLLNSNIDWGQDLVFLKRWLDQHREVNSLGLEYDGVCDPSVVGIQYHGVPIGPCKETILEPEQLGPFPGWHAISVNQIHAMGGQYEYFLKFEPVGMAGYSIYIYHITPEEANRVRKEMGLTELKGTTKEKEGTTK